jgi:hypothetical protein
MGFVLPKSDKSLTSMILVENPLLQHIRGFGLSAFNPINHSDGIRASST